MKKIFPLALVIMSLSLFSAAFSSAAFAMGPEDKLTEFLTSNHSCALQLRGGFSIENAVAMLQKNEKIWTRYQTLLAAYLNPANQFMTGIDVDQAGGRELQQFLSSAVVATVLRHPELFFKTPLVGEISAQTNSVALRVKINGYYRFGHLTGFVTHAKKFMNPRIRVNGKQYRILFDQTTQTRVANLLGYQDGYEQAPLTELWSSPRGYWANQLNPINLYKEKSFLIYDGQVFRPMNSNDAVYQSNGLYYGDSLSLR
jgi:hypothetical protein